MTEYEKIIAEAKAVATKVSADITCRYSVVYIRTLENIIKKFFEKEG